MGATLKINGRVVGQEHRPLVVAEIGINHEGSIDKAIQMVDDAAAAGCECAKFQCHVVEDEMIPNDVIPPNAKESIWNIMARCALTEAEDARLRALMSETPLADAEAHETRRHADAQARSRDALLRSIAELEREQDALLDRMAAELPS
jgi:sialic acid synthase SpsE